MFYAGSDRIESMERGNCRVAIASAILNISASVPLFLKKFTHASTKRQLSCAYPFVESIRSMLGAKIDGPLLERSYLKANPLIAQYPVHTLIAHASVRLQVIPFIAALFLAASTGMRHG